MKALVTGGAGFIGHHLVRSLLLDKIPVTVLDLAPWEKAWRLQNEPCAYICGDIQDLPSVRVAASGCDVIFHLAGLLGTDALVTAATDAVKTNILGTLNVLSVAAETSAVVVHTSLIPDWSNSYMITKQAASKFCNMYYRELSTNAVDLRLTHVYGPGQMWAPVRKVVPTFLRSAALGLPIEIYGKGDQLLDLIHVDDAVRAIRAAAEIHTAAGLSIEVGTGSAITLMALADIVLANFGNSSSMVRLLGRRVGEPEDPGSFRAADTCQQASILEFKPNIPLSTGLADTANWIQRRLDGEKKV